MQGRDILRLDIVAAENLGACAVHGDVQPVDGTFVVVSVAADDGQRVFAITLAGAVKFDVGGGAAVSIGVFITCQPFDFGIARIDGQCHGGSGDALHVQSGILECVVMRQFYKSTETAAVGCTFGHHTAAKLVVSIQNQT